jgi:hypothetical protein
MIPFGRGIPCIITLSNSGDTAAQVFTPDKARLTFSFDFTTKPGLRRHAR